MTITINQNTLPYQGVKIYPSYNFKSIITEIDPTFKIQQSTLSSFIPIIRNKETYLIPYNTSIESNISDRYNDSEMHKYELVKDLDFQVKEIEKRYILPDENEQITIYKYEQSKNLNRNI